MFLSPKTIEYHVRNVYRKLGVRSRPELAHALAARVRERFGDAQRRRMWRMIFSNLRRSAPRRRSSPLRRSR